MYSSYILNIGGSDARLFDWSNVSKALHFSLFGTVVSYHLLGTPGFN